MKTCRKCAESKSLADFTKDRRRADGVTGTCTQCDSSRKRSWEAHSGTSRASYFQKWNKSDAGRQAKRAWKERNKARDAAITKRWRQANPQRQYQYVKGFYGRNPHVVHEWHAKRKAAKLHATPAWADASQILEFYRKAAELTKETGVVHTVDHIIPLRGVDVCGLHVENNLQVLTRAANSKKSHREYPRWQ